MRQGTGLRDWVWGAVAIGLLIYAFVGLLQLAQEVETKGPGILLWLPLSALVYFWLIVGAWRRTTWGGSQQNGSDPKLPE
jgi:hypothetical protein